MENFEELFNKQNDQTPIKKKLSLNKKIMGKFIMSDDKLRNVWGGGDDGGNHSGGSPYCQGGSDPV
jgi:hypothetical protein